jgi:NADH:ubiquinone oxidoreductase subunit 3 (subunit A)
MLLPMKRRRFSISSAVVALILIVVLPYVVVQELWTFDLADRIGTVAVVTFLILLGIGAAIHAFRGKPFSEIGD